MHTSPLGQTMPKPQSTVGVEHLSFEYHLGGHFGEVVGEAESGHKDAILEGGSVRALEADSPLEQILVDQTHIDSQLILTLFKHQSRFPGYIGIVFSDATWPLFYWFRSSVRPVLKFFTKYYTVLYLNLRSLLQPFRVIQLCYSFSFMASSTRNTLILAFLLVLATIASSSVSVQEPADTKVSQGEYRYLVFTPQCYHSLIESLNITDVSCIKMTISKAMGYAIVVGGSIVKVPQVIKIFLDKSVYGISFTSVLAESCTNWVTIVYSWYRGNPFSIYGENAFILLQNICIMLLFVVFGRNVPKGVEAPGQGVITKYAILLVSFLVGMFLTQNPLAWPKQIIDYCMFLQISLFSFARLTQIIHIFRCKSTGSLALLTCVLVFMGNLARLFTVLVEISHDYIFAFSVLLATLLNGTILLQFFVYWKGKTHAKQISGKKQK